MDNQPRRIPDYDLSRIDKRRRKINDALWNAELYSHMLEPEAFDLMVVVIRRALNLKAAYDSVLRETLIEFAGMELTHRVSDMIALRVAGGFKYIREGKPIQVFTGLPNEGEWAPLEIAEMRLGQIKKDKLMLNMTCLVMGGTAVGQEVRQSLPGKFVVSVLSRELGWPRFKARPTHSELVRTWFFGLLVPEAYRKIQIADFKCLPHQKKYNKWLRDSRNSPCLLNYRHQCRTCPVGYMQCERGTHRYTWVFKECPKCQTRSIYDPSEPNSKICLRCRSRNGRNFWAQERRSYAE